MFFASMAFNSGRELDIDIDIVYSATCLGSMARMGGIECCVMFIDGVVIFNIVGSNIS